MPERSAINQTIQIGVETTPGTPVAATKTLGSIGFAMGINVDSTTSRPTGQKYASQHIVGKEWTAADISGNPSYEELPYLFSSLFSSPEIVPVTEDGGTGAATKWVFDTKSFGDDAPKTFTIEQGSSFRAHRASSAIISELNIEWSRDEISLGGSAFARAIEDGITMTPNPTGFKQIPVKPDQLSVYLDDSADMLGNTKLTRALEGEMSVSDRFSPLWVVDRDLPSFASIVEGEPSVEFTIRQMADEQAMENLLAMRGGATKFFRAEWVGPIIFGTGPTATRYSFVFDMAGQVSDVDNFDETDGVFSIEWTFGAVHDSTWGKAMHAEVVNTQTAL